MCGSWTMKELNRYGCGVLGNILCYIPCRKVVIDRRYRGYSCVAYCRPSPARLSPRPCCVVAALRHFISFFPRFSASIPSLENGVDGEHSGIYVGGSRYSSTSPLRGRCDASNRNTPWTPVSCLDTAVCPQARPKEAFNGVFIPAPIRSWIYVFWHRTWHSNRP